MTGQEQEGGQPSAAAGGMSRFALPLFALVIGGLLLAEASRLPLGQDYSALGPGFFVFAVGVALVAIASGLFVKVLKGEEFGPEAAEGADADAPVSLYRLGLAGAGIALPMVLMGFIGFPVTSAFAYACVARAFGSRGAILLDIAIGFVLSSLVWLAFTKLGVQLGPFLPMGGK